MSGIQDLIPCTSGAAEKQPPESGEGLCDASEIPLISSPDRIYLSDGLRTCNSCLLPMSPAMQFLPTSRRLVQFSNGRVAPDGARIVYIDGAFDVFHPGHVKILKVGKRILPPISSRSPPTCLTSSPLRRVKFYYPKK